MVSKIIKFKRNSNAENNIKQLRVEKTISRCDN